MPVMSINQSRGKKTDRMRRAVDPLVSRISRGDFSIQLTSSACLCRHMLRALDKATENISAVPKLKLQEPQLNFLTLGRKSNMQGKIWRYCRHPSAGTLAP